MMVGPSSQTPTILLTGVGTDDPTLTFSSSGSQKEEQEQEEPNSTNPSSSLRVVSSVVSYDAPHQKVDRRPPLREQRKPRKGKRKAPPKDQKATKRLRDQRKKEDEAIQALYGLFVPDDVGVKQKKDWLSTSTRSYILGPPHSKGFFSLVLRERVCGKRKGEERLSSRRNSLGVYSCD
ncbi:hypothetical protein B0F90DRAFT_334341 [Multifurca ochricompacta]|uniref:Uncharacterized protein n=1 Tax=Multifurca ochricompacta TaxID=376703 RepID=A0AAD4LW58_9AGAM|nr:hypothetical protein B0F90DRAFT_334341 [Multifurca ochricompacta]